MLKNRLRVIQPIFLAFLFFTLSSCKKGTLSSDNKLNSGSLKKTAAMPLLNCRFPFGWYVIGIEDPAAAISDGSNLLMAYSYWSDGGGTTEINQYLTNVNNRGAKAVYEIPRGLMEPLNITAIKTFVNAINANPGLYGYYLKDEPYDPALLADMKAAYNAIKSISVKPVLVTFGSGGDPIAFAGTYDIFTQDEYRCNVGEAEFTGMPKYMSSMDYASQASGTLGKPWWAVTQAFAGQFDRNYRLPTCKEHRFNVYYAILKGANGISNWGRPWCTGQAGADWITNVFKPVAAEVNRDGDMFPNGPSTVVTVSVGAGVLCKAFERSNGEISAVTARITTGTTKNTVTIDLGSKFKSTCNYVVKLNGSSVSYTKSGTSLSIMNVQYTSYKVNLFQISSCP